jgi:HAE1 family hydrophobic/amphiphilic exporter-1
LGFTINKLTLFGFVLAIGIVVDDAIIVVEAVQRYIEEQHLTPKEAAFKAMADISGPVVAIALVLAAVFVPAGFLPGIVGKLYQQFAITIAISVLISAFVALSLTPALCSLFLKPHHINKSSKGTQLTSSSILINGSPGEQKGYTKNVRFAIKHSRYVVILLVMVIFGAYFMLLKKPTGFIPVEDEGRLYITFELPEASSTSRQIEVLKKMMEYPS